MPFTVSHVAAVLPAYRPLSRARLFSAAVIGSMVPDFGLLLPGMVPRWETHSLGALWTFSLPVGMVAFALTVLLIAPALTEVLPDRAYARLRLSEAKAPSRPLWRTLVYAAPVIVLGAVTHLLWDGFTHENARGVRMFPILDEFGPELDGHTLHLFRWLQYASSIAGLVAVIVALLVWMHHAPSAAAARMPRRLGSLERRIWSGGYIVVALSGIAASAWRAHAQMSASAAGLKIGAIAIGAMRASAVSLVLVSVFVLLRLRIRGQAAQT
jgi:Domain of unknown function (DUF4184)